MGKASKANSGKNQKVTDRTPITEENQNQSHNTKKESDGRNTKR